MVMAGQKVDESWTVPLHVIVWTTILVGLIMAIAIGLMH